MWFRRGRLLMISPDSRGTACPPSGRNSTYRPVQISGTSSIMVVMIVIIMIINMTVGGMIGSIATTAVVTIIGIFRGPTAVVDNCQISLEESRMFIRPL